MAAAAPVASAAPAASPAAPAAAAAAAAAPADPNAKVNYFAIGSMINPVSLSLRNLVPSFAKPAILRDFELAFMGELGMGTVLEKPGAHLHGVVYTVTAAEMVVLDRIEGGYDRLPVTVEFYDGTSGQATVYKFKAAFMELAKKKTNPPSERYLDIITRGCVHHGVAPEWIAYLKTVKVVPRRKPHELKAYPDATAETPVMTVAELAKCDGNDGRPLRLAVNAKVLTFSVKQEDSRLPLAYVRSNLAGKDVTLYMSRNLFEPLFPVATCEEDIAPGLRAVIEDQLYTMWGDQWTLTHVLPPTEPAAIAAAAAREANAKAKSAVAVTVTASAAAPAAK